jgi:hypothetical protein
VAAPTPVGCNSNRPLVENALRDQPRTWRGPDRSRARRDRAVGQSQGARGGPEAQAPPQLTQAWRAARVGRAKVRANEVRLAPLRARWSRTRARRPGARTRRSRWRCELGRRFRVVQQEHPQRVPVEVAGVDARAGALAEVLGQCVEPLLERRVICLVARGPLPGIASRALARRGGTRLAFAPLLGACRPMSGLRALRRLVGHRVQVDSHRCGVARGTRSASDALGAAARDGGNGGHEGRRRTAAGETGIA